MDYQLLVLLLGRLAWVLTLLQLLPLGVALACQDGQSMVHVRSLALSAIVAYSLSCYGKQVRRQRLRSREVIALTTLGWLLICMMGALPYLFSGLGPVGALFESVAAFTTTGATTYASLAQLSPSLLVWRCLSQWCGGLGIILLFITLVPQMSNGAGYLFNAELPGTYAERTLPKIRSSAMLVLLLYSGLTLLQLVLLLAAGMDLFPALQLALTTMATGGFALYNDQLIAYASPVVEFIALIFMLVGSMSFSLYYRLCKGSWQAIAQDREHIYFLYLLAAGGSLIAADLYLHDCYGLMDSLRYGFFQAVSIGSTTGLAAADYSSWPSFSRYLLFLLLFVGGCGGSTAGGIKISRMVILGKAAWAELLRTLHPKIVYSVKMGSRTIEPTIVGNITRFFFLYILVFMSLTILISLAGLSMTDSMGLIAACLSSVGPAFGILGPACSFSELGDYARLVSILAMLLGRLEIFTLLVVLQPGFWSRKQGW